MSYVTSIKTRLSRSARGELFNPLIYPFLIATFFYGLGFTFFSGTAAVDSSSLHTAMLAISPALTVVWGVLAIVVILVGAYVLIFDKPPIGKANCFVAWSLWFFAAVVYALTGGWLPLLSVALPSLWFWTWQYFSLAKFRAQDVLDRATMVRYDDGQYDDNNGGRARREDNRGVDTDDRTPD